MSVSHVVLPLHIVFHFQNKTTTSLELKQLFSSTLIEALLVYNLIKKESTQLEIYRKNYKQSSKQKSDGM